MNTKKDFSNRQTRPHHVTGIDGLRTIAVLGVIIYHLLPTQVKGGFLGVPLFLLISGYFITYQFSKKFERGRALGLGHFYAKRFYRLYPVLITMLVLTIAYITLFARELLHNIRQIFVTNILWVYNWWEIYHGQSYFDQFANKSPFTHLWTLGVEAQFYVLWPVIIYFLFKIFKKRSIVQYIVLVLAFLSAIEMAILYHPTTLNRVYYGTDTRAFSLLLGSWLGLVWPLDRLKKNISGTASRALDGLGLLTLIITLYGFISLDGQSAFTYYGGMFFYSVVGMVLMATILHPGSHMNRWLTNPFFTWCGQRSYGIYVYQYPVLVFYERAINVGVHPVVSGIEELAIIVIISECSYRLIEQPLLKQRLSDIKWDKLCFNNWRQASLAIVALLVVGTTVYGLCQPNVQPKKTDLQKRIEKNDQLTEQHNKQLSKGKNIKTAKISTIQKKYQLSKTEIERAQKLKVTAVGDSVMLDASDSLQQLMPHAYVDAKVGRQGSQTPKILSQLKDEGHLNQIVVLNLGNNGAMDQKTIDEILNIIGKDRQVYWVTPHIPTKSWQQQVNSQIQEVAKKHHNVYLVNWYAASNGQSGWFAKDGVHMNKQGNNHYAKLITKTILKHQ
ncbi:acyltransferase family protein [Limosilactobacillus fastidiosus]|uniref:Acetyltransferase n=1 Tax=Limosilactobacillus fastidiosus TaxID=2759855 RepID=A0A7W3TZD5_9LACO|nr:acyltransferase family protein [Limosilactobacillus fastidiosus]MBB1063278.1 acetyltransferase [Limosilactobacillus fastidiosus]MBB1086082.1 acetyltransferase [Limosilactobacillus fastidiosus]MCD7084588.1 acetyltransferase [Limosilactobacillus fastidiosus]MCD7084996.1 acetyltransferase [Limosilactobacillus fastidiosus]MCD7114508.1 acetyltransferase [Limosilactobacillus fastidiosus]